METAPDTRPAPRPYWRGLPVRSVDALCALAPALRNSDTDAAFWDRTLPQAFADWLNVIPAERWPQGRFVLRPADITACLADALAASQVLPAPALTWFGEDVTRLAECMQDLSGAPMVRLRMEPVFDDACSKLHIDNVVARMICTYSGPATELGLDAVAPESAERIPTGAPVLLKGKRWPDEQQPSLRHRSPPIAGTGQARLVVVLEGCLQAEIYPQYDTLYPSSNAQSER